MGPMILKYVARILTTIINGSLT